MTNFLSRTLLIGLVVLMSRIDIPLWGDQARFVRSPSHAAAIFGGVGSGKSMGGAVRAMLASQGHVGETRILVPNVGVVTAPTYTMLRDATLKSFREVADPIIDTKASAFAAPMRIVMRNGSEVLFRSADNPEHLRGPNVSWWWNDEAALTGYDAYLIMIARLRQGGKFGYHWQTTTPKGRNWLWKIFMDNPILGSEYFRVRTRDNPFLALEFVQSLEAAYTGDFASQELEGIFVSFEGLIYSMFDRERHIAPTLPDAFVRTVAGVDWGFDNPGVILVFGLDYDNRMYLVHEEYRRQRGIDEWVNVAVQLRDIYRIETFYCDPSKPDYIQKFAAQGCRAVAANNTVSTGLQAVQRRLARRASDGVPGLQLYRGAAQTAVEFDQYQWARRNGVSLDEPVKANDHALDALRYAVMGVDENRSGKVVAKITRWA